MRLRDVWILWTGLVLFIGIRQVSSESTDQQLEDKYNWWQHEVFYQIYPRSFKDSDGDGIGDLKGITSKLEYFVQTGITAVWLSPIYESPMNDFGYDISNYTAIQPEYGTMDDFDELLANAKRLGIKVILDFVPNHSSDQHDWFKKSVAREPGYEDYYIWQDGKKLANGSRAPPNNWVSVFDGSAWEWNEQRQQYYLRQFIAAQPDLNYRNPAVLEAMDNVMLYWLKKGVAGFRIDAVIYVYENEELLDEPLSGSTDDPNSAEYLDHIYTRNLPEDIKLIQHWRQLLQKYSQQNDGPERIMMTEGYADLQTLMKYYEDNAGIQGAQFPFNFDFISDVNAKSTAHDFVYYIQRWLTNMPAGHAPNWVMGNHDNARVGSRFGAKSVDAMNMLLLTLPGIAVTYYGEELGMLDYRDITWEQTVDQPACEAGPEKYKWISRDPERTPMQWSDEPFAGFSSHASWLPVHPNYKELNLHAQQQANRSHYQLYKSLLSLRKDSLFRNGNFIPKVYNNAVFAFKRQLQDRRSALTIINVSNSSQQVDLSDFVKEPNLMHVLATTVDSQNWGQDLKPSQVALGPYEGLVVQLKDLEQ